MSTRDSRDSPVAEGAPAPQPWSAPTSHGPIAGRVRVPGSKSVTNRALVLAALADSPSLLVNPLRSRDTELMAAAMRSLGAGITEEPSAEDADQSSWRVLPIAETGAGSRSEGPVRIDCGLAGTVMRFVPPLAALLAQREGTSEVIIDGDQQARRRPMRELLEALRQLGARVHGDALPLRILPGTDGAEATEGSSVGIDASRSSQFVTGLLLPAARFPRGLQAHHTGTELPSRAHIAMTVSMLRARGVEIEETTSAPGDARPATVWRVAPGPIAGMETAIEPDLSNATPFLAAAAVTAGDVTVLDWPSPSLQPATRIADIFRAFGCTVEVASTTMRVTGPERLRGVRLDLSEVSELTPTVAAIAAHAAEPSELTGIAHLRGHETDRLAALRTELNAAGCEATETGDGLRIAPGAGQSPGQSGERPVCWHAYADHRMATAGAIIGLRIPGLTVDDIACTSKTLPSFAELWHQLVGP